MSVVVVSGIESSIRGVVDFAIMRLCVPAQITIRGRGHGAISRTARTVSDDLCRDRDQAPSFGHPLFSSSSQLVITLDI